MDRELRRLLRLYGPAPDPPDRPGRDLAVPLSTRREPREIFEKWIRPFYLQLSSPARFADAYAPLREDVTPTLVSELLYWRNWRSRLVGGYFAAIERMSSATEYIGRLLIRKELGFCTRGFVLALVAFETEPAAEFLTRYLDEVLPRTRASESSYVVAAAAYRDELHGTQLLERYLPVWEALAKTQLESTQASIGRVEPDFALFGRDIAHIALIRDAVVR